MVEKLVTDYEPRQIILFGSYAHGDPDTDSDIDVLIVKETSERFLDRWVTVHRILTGLHHSLPIEPLVLTPQELEDRLASGDQFIAEIVERGTLLYAA
ncbi:MAG: nucleotidyltransferase domain-containing protein [Chloroflexota bacterium]